MHIIEILRALDLAAATKIAVLPLRYGDAGQIANQIDALLVRDAKTNEPLRVVVDARTNSLIVQGSPGRVRAVRDYVELVDRPAPSKGRVHVVRVMNVDAEELADKLRAIAAQRSGSGTGAGRAAADTDHSRAHAPTNSLLISASGTFAALGDDRRARRDPPRLPSKLGLVGEMSSPRPGPRRAAALIIPSDEGDAVAFTLLGNPAADRHRRGGGSPFVARTRRPFLVHRGSRREPDDGRRAIRRLTASAGAAAPCPGEPISVGGDGEEQHLRGGTYRSQ